MTNALTAADSVLIPLCPEFYSTEGLGDLIRSVLKNKRRLNPDITFEGIVFSRCNLRTNLYRSTRANVEKAYYGAVRVFQSAIPDTVKVGDAISRGLTVMEYAPDSKASTAYRAFAKELMEHDTQTAATGFATDIIVQNGDVGTALLSDELWKLLGANSNPLAADYTMQMVKLIRSQGGIAGVTSQGMADMMALDGGKYGKGILDSCRVKIILQMEEQEARLVQEKLDLTEEETRMITRFRRGEGLLCIGHNHVPIAIHVSPKEYEAITTSPTDRRARLKGQ